MNLCRYLDCFHFYFSCLRNLCKYLDCIVEKLQEPKNVSENFPTKTDIGLETEAAMSEPTRSVQSIVNQFEDLVTNVDELLNGCSEKVKESQESEVETIEVQIPGLFPLLLQLSEESLQIPGLFPLLL
jgi:hypothetical protein